MAEKDRPELSGGSPEEIYRELIKNYSGYVYAVVMNRLNRVGTREDVEDCVSAVFVEIYTSLGGFSPDRGNIRAYIGSIADRKAVDFFRRLSYRQKFSGSDELPDVPSQDDTESETDRRLMKKRLWEAVEALGKPDSEIIILQYFYNMKLREIAKRLGMSTDAVRKRSLRARNKLKEIMKG